MTSTKDETTEPDREPRAFNHWLRDMSRSRRAYRIAVLRQLVEIHELLERLTP